MGRAIRRVPPNWEHPKTESGDYLSLYDDTYEQAAKEWIDGLAEWEDGKNPDREEYNVRYFWDWSGGPPSEESCRPVFQSDPTWYQLYETVSEGSPVSPPFETLELLATYLSENGDFWYQKDKRDRRDTFRTKPTYNQALAMVTEGWAPSMVISNGNILQPHEMNEK